MGINEWWGRAYEHHKPEYTDLFDVAASSQNYEEDVLISSFGLAQVKNQGASVTYDDETQGYVSRYTHVAYSLGFICTKEEIDDNLYETVAKRRAEALAFSMNQTRENVCANVYNRAFNNSYTGGDAVEMISTSHVTGDGTQSNHLTVAADLSETSLEDLIIQVMGATNHDGLKISLMPKSLIVPRQLYFEANRIVESVLQNDTANNATNVLKAHSVIPEGVKVNHYLTDQDAFFVRTNCPNALRYFDRVPVQFTEDNDFDTENKKYKAYMRFSASWSDWRGVYGSPGA